MAGSFIEAARVAWHTIWSHQPEHELALRKLRDEPLLSNWVDDNEGAPVGPVVETEVYWAISVIRDQIPYMIRCRLTELILGEGLQANAFRYTGETRWVDNNHQVARFQPVWVDDIPALTKH